MRKNVLDMQNWYFHCMTVIQLKYDVNSYEYCMYWYPNCFPHHIWAVHLHPLGKWCEWICFVLFFQPNHRLKWVNILFKKILCLTLLFHNLNKCESKLYLGHWFILFVIYIGTYLPIFSHIQSKLLLMFVENVENDVDSLTFQMILLQITYAFFHRCTLQVDLHAYIHVDFIQVFILRLQGTNGTFKHNYLNGIWCSQNIWWQQTLFCL